MKHCMYIGCVVQYCHTQTNCMCCVCVCVCVCVCNVVCSVECTMKTPNSQHVLSAIISVCEFIYFVY